MASQIRLADVNDHAAIDTIVGAAYARYVPRIGRMPGPMLDDYAARIRERRVYVICDDTLVRGLVVLIPETDAMLLDNVAVDPAAQGLGFGRALLEFAEQAARTAGYASVRLYTNEAMTENITLYARLGYRETHRAEDNGLRRVYMLKSLA